MTEKFRVSQTIETSSIKKQYVILTEKTEREAKIILQILQGDKSLLNISVLRVIENEKYKYTISVESDTNSARVEQTSLKRLKWLDWPTSAYMNIIEERGFDFLFRQLTRDLFVFIMENSSWKKVLRYNR